MRLIRVLIVFVALAVGASIFSASAGASARVVVNSATDDYDTPTGCSLREAIESVNTDANFGGCVKTGDPYDTIPGDVVQIPAGNFVLSRHGQDNDNETGDLDITEPLFLNLPAGDATIDGDSENAAEAERDRVIDVLPGAGDLIRLNQDEIADPSETGFLTIKNGWASDGCGGGGIVANSDVVLFRTRVVDNYAPGDGFCDTPNGGGIAGAGNINLTNSEVARNEAEGNGGGIAETTSAVNVFGTAIHNNIAGERGGGIWRVGGDPPAGGYAEVGINDSTVAHNEAEDEGLVGGGVYMAGGDLHLTHATIARNDASPGGNAARGGGVVTESPTDVVVIANSLIADNAAGATAADCDFDLDGTFTSQGGNLLRDSSSCGWVVGPGDKLNTDPQLAPIGEYGGPLPTQTLPPYVGSPALNAGNPSVCTSQDQRQAPRDATCDSGAYEGAVNRPPFTPPVPQPGPQPVIAPLAPTPTTGRRAAAIRRCKKKDDADERKQCKKKARKLPV